MAGDEQTGVSIMRVTAGLDSGPVCLQGAEPIGPEDTYGSLASRLWELGGELLVRALAESPACAEQDETLATYAEKITAADRALDPARPAAELERVVRALTPHIGAYAELQDGTRLGVSGARALPEAADGAGRIIVLDGRAPALVCDEGVLLLLTVKPAGRREMSGEDWLRGWQR
jgi:methionyl-tRNA formyltransferase